MQTLDEKTSDPTRKVPWNKGKLLGSKPPLQTKQVWTIRTKLQVEHRLRDLAMFNLAIDSKLRGCDLVSLKVEDVAPHGFALERATVRQRKTGHPVKFELTEQTREAIDAYMTQFGRRPGDFLFPSRRYGARCISTRQYARLLANWSGKCWTGPEDLRQSGHALPTFLRPSRAINKLRQVTHYRGAQGSVTSTDHSSFDFDWREASERLVSLASCPHLLRHRLSQ
jgi:integrase